MDNILTCSICGFKNDKSILSHVRRQHHMSASQYKNEFNMPLRKCWAQDNSVFFKNLGKANAARMLNQPSRAKLHNKWSRKFDKCVICGSTEKKHASHGVCTRCDSRAKMKQRTLSSNLNIMNNGVEGDDYIICQICKNPYKILTHCGHLREHGITLEQYKKMFPSAQIYCKKSRSNQSIGISNGRKSLMLKRGYLNPQSQRNFKRAEMVKKHSNKEFATVSKIEDVVSQWFKKNNYGVYWNNDYNFIASSSKFVIRQYIFLDKYCVDFACPEKKIIIEVLGDWWHGWEFICGNKKFTEQYPVVKKNIKLDEIRFKAILDAQWMLIKIWEHDIQNDNFINILKQYF